MGRLVVFEGTDGAGKTAQIQKLSGYFGEKGVPYAVLDFPDYSSFFGQLVARYLRGELGELASINPYLTCLPYALDRMQARPKIMNLLQDYDYVLVNRYTYSNIAFHAPKLTLPEDQEAFRNWVLQLEFEIIGLPEPDLVLWLKVPLEVNRERIKKRSQRHYVQGKGDIHEQSDWLLRAANREYALMAESLKWHVVDASRSMEEVHRQVLCCLGLERS